MRGYLVPVLLFVSICSTAIAFGPSCARWWLREQLLAEFFDAQSSAEQELVVISLAQLLPESTDQLIQSLVCEDPNASKVAHEALGKYLQSSSSMNEETQIGRFANVLHIVEASIAKLPNNRKAPAVELASQATTMLRQNPFSGSSVLLTSCDRILQTQHKVAGENNQSNLIARLSSKKSYNSIGTSDRPRSTPSEPREGTISESIVIPSRKPASGNLKDLTSTGATVVIDRPNTKSMEETAVIHPSLAQNRNHLANPNNVEDAKSNNTLTKRDLNQPRSTDEKLSGKATKPEVDETARSNPTTVESPRVHSNSGLRISPASLVSDANGLRPEATSSTDIVNKSLSDASDSDSNSASEVVGIDRQKTEDLIALLGSVRARVASAALFELERRGMSPLQLDIAVELARGTSATRLVALDKLVNQQEFDPTPWLGWLAADRDRTVRYRSISLLGSVNSIASRTKLRLLLARERDEELTRHIQQILLGGVKTNTARSSSLTTTR